MKNEILREARPDDIAAILSIYAPYISTAITFETELPSPEDMLKRFAIFSRLGWFVYEVDGHIIGYAYASPHRERKAYQWCCEVSAYVAPQFHRRGIAGKLYTHLISVLREKSYVNVYAGITLPNEASVAFHEALGFKHIGTYDQIGFKSGQWRDVGWWGLRINPLSSNPRPIK